MTRTDSRTLIALKASDRVAVVTGSGRLPINVAEGLHSDGHTPFIIFIGTEQKEPERLTMFPSITLPMEQVAQLMPLMKRQGITHVVLAGGIHNRPSLRSVRPSFALLKLLPKFVAALAQGDNGLLSMLVRHLEANGMVVVGAHEIVPDLLAEEGVMTSAKPTASDQRDISAALMAAQMIGALDIGQAAVAIGGRAVALEGVEGTDGLLERMRGLRSNGRIAGQKRGVLVKCAKPGQELRADLPTIGPATVEAAHAAGLAGIAVQADRSLVLDRKQAVDRANALGLFIVGLPRGEA